MFRRLLLFACLASTAAFSFPLSVIDFENILSLTELTNEYPGVNFTNASVITSAIDLNEFDFPPKSGQNVAMDFGGPVIITFDQPVNSFSAYFTYVTKIGLEFYDNSNTILGTVMSSVDNNTGLGGTAPPNELLQFTNAAGFLSVHITGSALGQSFVVDDIQLGSTQVPEPGTFGLLLVACAGVAVYRRKK